MCIQFQQSLPSVFLKSEKRKRITTKHVNKCRGINEWAKEKAIRIPTRKKVASGWAGGRVRFNLWLKT